MNLQKLRHFVALAEAGTFTRAAERIHLTQPALSRSIAQLEAELGLKLIDRIGKKNEITAFGRAVLEHARHVVFEADELSRVVAMQRGGAGGRIRVGLGSTPSAVLAAPLLAYATRQQRRLRLTLARGPIPQQVTALRERRLDMLVVESSSIPPTSDLSLEILPPLRVGFLARRGHPAARRKRLSFSDVALYPLASTIHSEAQTRGLIANYGPRAHPDESLTIVCEDIASMIDCVVSTNTVYFGIVAPAREKIEAKLLVELPVRPEIKPSLFAIVRLPGRSEPPALSAIRDIVYKQMRD
ncbi:LysR family transcriptional regulator [Bradyrhizobium sp. B120]|uniref:LysR family transcriptional regulator n=1 Tax=Bradyrhizobium sp. B120 TaxID=3410088 RepID=UPI003B97EEF7